MFMDRYSWLSISVLAMLLGSSCTQYIKYIPDPEKDVERWVENFKQQRSFHFTYKLKTTAVQTTAHGECVIGRGAHIKGEWISSEGKVPFEYIGLGHLEYSRQNGSWETSPRGEQSDILTQIARLLEFDKFEYIGLSDGYYYRFKANIPFLAPHRWKEMIGTMKVSTRSYQPELIWAGLPDSSVYWEIRMFRFNKQKKIDAPVKKLSEYLIHVPVDQRKVIDRRLKLVDVEHQIKIREDGLLLVVPEYYTIDDIVHILGLSSWYVFAVVPKDSAQRVAHLQGNTKKPVYIGETLLKSEDVKDVKIKYDGARRPFFEIKLTKKHILPEALAFEVNGVVCDVTTLDRTGKINTLNMYSDMPFFNMQVLRASMLQSLPVLDVKTVSREHN